jgi:starch synthase (maltosyl-transferring)
MTKKQKTPNTELPADELGRRVWVENLRPSVDGGRHAVKRTVGQDVRATADVFADGHDALAAVLRYKRASSTNWREVPMKPGANDTWSAEFCVEVQEPHVFTVMAWIDRFGTWRDALKKKADAGESVPSELLEGATLVEQAAARASARDGRRLKAIAAELGGDGPESERVAAALEEELRGLMTRWDSRARATTAQFEQRIEVARERARFSAWYEFFPRSAGPEPGRSATFDEATGRLEEIARMGFDIVYLPPIHPIGDTNRKGRNNTMDPGPDDPGSPWAIGSAEGGHTAVHPELGTLEDFDRFVSKAGEHGLEVALDIAFQCSPDHPWVRAHPEWFMHRPDGTIKYAENPPKKYQDIYPLNFDCEEWRALWAALRDVVLFWADRGVRVFRVDNPHTKPLRFWGWLIAQVKATHPDAIFLSEAFTRPNVMYTLAKVGFDQSYSYFTWRNSKQELTSYFGELTRTEVREYFRCNLWPNTPDILPEYLQYGGRPAFLGRLVLAATLGANYGIYSGYELCENRGLPGREEYEDSEKYQLKARDWNATGNLRDFITRVNRIRRENPALSSDDRLRFHPTDNEQLLFYSKSTEDLDNIILVVVNLDPHHAHSGWIEVPVEAFGLRDDQNYQVHDLIGEGRYLWRGSRNYVRLDPTESPAQIFRLRRRVRTESDFDYFL